MEHWLLTTLIFLTTLIGLLLLSWFLREHPFPNAFHSDQARLAHNVQAGFTSPPRDRYS